MTKYTIKRILMMIPVLIGVSILLFMIQALPPGDPANIVLGQDAPAEDKEAWREENGLNDPIVIQYMRYVKNIVTKGDFGVSYRNGKPITGDLIERWPTTLKTCLLSLLAAAMIGIPLGILSALKHGTWIDSLSRAFGVLGVSIPNFWLALMLIIVFALNLRWFPVSGSYGPIYWVLPIATLGVNNAANIMRYTRAAVLDNVKQDFVRTARAKGQKESKVVMHHIMGNAMIPIATCIGIFLVSNMAGTIVIEQIFSLPGLGSLMITAVTQRDYPVLRGCILLVAVTTCVINLGIDLLYALIDPRIKARLRQEGKNGMFTKRKKGGAKQHERKADTL